MKCNLNNRDKIIEKYLSGEITETERQEFDKHCFNCDSCFKELMLREQTQSLIKTEGDILFADYIEKKSAKENRVPVKQFLENLVYKKNWQPIFAYAAAAIVVIVIGFSLLIGNHKTESHQLIFDNDVPYEYDNSTLRGAVSSYESDQLFDQFIYLFKMGMSAYMSCEYLDAIGMFNQIETFVNTLKTDDENSQHVKWIRDFYFYRGLTSFSISLSKKYNLNKENKSQYLNQAIKDLKEANDITSLYDLDKKQRGYYFLAIVLDLNNQSQAALKVLQNINSDSQFYEESQKLIRKHVK